MAEARSRGVLRRIKETQIPRRRSAKGTLRSLILELAGRLAPGEAFEMDGGVVRYEAAHLAVREMAAGGSLGPEFRVMRRTTDGRRRLFLVRSARAQGPRRIDPRQAADLRARLRTFATDWDRPEMDVYDRL